MGGGVNSYVAFMRDRLEQMHRLLKPFGSIYVHLDWQTVHYIKVEMDKIFGEKNFQREIIWSFDTKSGYKTKTENWIRSHETILFYCKGEKKKKFNKQFLPYDKKYLSRFKHKDKKGRKYRNDRTGGRVQYLDKSKGVCISDVWSDVNSFQQNSTSKEKIGYPTQKPIRLLERIIKASTNKKDIVADFFCGCGTTISAAQKLGRYWLGVDASKKASKVIRQRMARDHKLKIKVTPLGKLTKAQIKKLDPFEFERYMVTCIGGVANSKQRGDGGIDGRMVEDGTPIQVKKSHNVGRTVIDSFYRHLKKTGRGYIIANSFAKTAKEEAMKLKINEGLELILLTTDQVIKQVA